MQNFFHDKYLNSKLLSRVTKQVKQEQLEKTIKEIDCFNKHQETIISRYDYKNAKLKNL